ncbi:uncharacterized protein LOC114935124 isoform X2 [Nylanderia fulva]|uniref:uncharacterized protein LOC114935124 isoform X2 n=1 Tax=Nylanderia fulva TaxID=613905 RepID=UPI0010FB7DF4|nr:uncharacterized protein LOC114935124 isoform X2 [Nylanderia fulva]
MGLCNIECVERIAQYLDVPSKRLEISNKNVVVLIPESEKNSPLIQGFSTVIQALVAKSKCSDLLCGEKEVQALTQQWLEYVAVCVNHADLSINAKRVLNKELNRQEKAQYIHVSRWFDNIQQEERLRRDLDMISFNLLHLFL